MVLTKQFVAGALAGFAVLFCCACSQESVAKDWDDPENTKSSHEATFEDHKVDLKDKLHLQKMADDVAAEVAADVERHRFSTASKVIRARVHHAQSWGDDAYSCYITELNEQLERKNVFGLLGLRQRPQAALTPAQFTAEKELYGDGKNCTMLASVLSMIRPEAIRQGELGDCWFLSTLAVVANDYPFLIPAMIRVDTEGTYLVKFPGNPGPPLRVHLPPDGEQDGIGVHHTEYGRWPEVLELAAAQLFPHEIQTGGWASKALKLLTGINSTAWCLFPDDHAPVMSAAVLSETVVKGLDTNEPILISTNALNVPGHEPGPFAPNHVYSIVGYLPANEEQGAQVTLRNPWGRLGFDPNLVPEIVPAKDGHFYIPVTTLHKYFGWVIVANNVILPLRQPQPKPQQQQPQVTNDLPTVPQTYIRARPAPPRPKPTPDGLPRVPQSYILHR